MMNHVNFGQRFFNKPQTLQTLDTLQRKVAVCWVPHVKHKRQIAQCLILITTICPNFILPGKMLRSFGILTAHPKNDLPLRTNAAP